MILHKVYEGLFKNRRMTCFAKLFEFLEYDTNGSLSNKVCLVDFMYHTQGEITEGNTATEIFTYIFVSRKLSYLVIIFRVN